MSRYVLEMQFNEGGIQRTERRDWTNPRCAHNLEQAIAEAEDKYQVHVYGPMVFSGQTKPPLQRICILKVNWRGRVEDMVWEKLS